MTYWPEKTLSQAAALRTRKREVTAAAGELSAQQVSELHGPLDPVGKPHDSSH